MEKISLATVEADAKQLYWEHGMSHGVYPKILPTSGATFSGQPFGVSQDTPYITQPKAILDNERITSPHNSFNSLENGTDPDAVISRYEPERDSLSLKNNITNFVYEKKLEILDSVTPDGSSTKINFLNLELEPLNPSEHFAKYRQIYLAMALAEAAARGIEINLDTSVDAVNVKSA